MNDLQKVLSSSGFVRVCEQAAIRHGIDGDGLRNGCPIRSEIDPAEVAAVVRWMLLGRTPSKSEVVTSYGAKHVAERWSRALGGVGYVANGAAIVAMAILIPGWSPKKSDGINQKWRNVRSPSDAYSWLYGCVQMESGEM